MEKKKDSHLSIYMYVYTPINETELKLAGSCTLDLNCARPNSNGMEHSSLPRGTKKGKK